MTERSALPLAGVKVIELAPAGTSLVATGLASTLPGSLLRDFGAEVTRIESGPKSTLDAGIEWHKSWNRGKRIVTVEDDRAGARSALDFASSADILFLAGPEEAIEHYGVGYPELATVNSELIVGRIRPSYTAAGLTPDFELLVQARAGIFSQIYGHREGPIFCDLPIGSAGAALAVTAAVLGCLYERVDTGQGGWVESSLYDGVLTILPMAIGRVEDVSPSIAGKWVRNDRPNPLSYRCRDGKYLQLWFGAKGAYEDFLDFIGDPPSVEGYAADMRGGEIARRSTRWTEVLLTADRDDWVDRMAGKKFRCEPVLRPGEALRDPHLAHIGLSISQEDPERGNITVLGPVGQISSGDEAGAPQDGATSGGRLLTGLRVLDLSAYLAGPVTPLVLAEMGADVIKVEPVTGDVHRGVETMYAAGQRGKRVVALDLKAPDSKQVLHRLFEWADVIHHNGRVGLAERLGYDELTARSVNPGVIYSHASGFGPTGPRALLAANDHLMQALSGLEAGCGSAVNGPTYLDWGSIDVTSGWIAASAILVGLYAKRRSGRAQTISSTLLGAAITLKSGAFLDGDAIVEGPMLDGNQTGYGAAYRIYQAGDGSWLALAVPDASAWTRLLTVVGPEGLPATPPPLRTQADEHQPAEAALEAKFATQTAATWLDALAAAGVPAAEVAEYDRLSFIGHVLDDPVNRQLGRITAFDWGPRGLLEQPAFPARMGPAPRPVAPQQIPSLGCHTAEVLGALGFSEGEIGALASAGVIAGVVSGRPDGR